MGMAELSIIAPVLVVVAGAYLSIYPKIAGNNFNKTKSFFQKNYIRMGVGLIHCTVPPSVSVGG